MTEYTKLSRDETLYGKKNMLQLQLELLTILKRIKEYRSLRNDEFALKISLKNKVDETLLAIQNFEKLIPKMKIPDMPRKQQPAEQDYESTPSIFHKDLSIDQELERIKAKLSKLR